MEDHLKTANHDTGYIKFFRTLIEHHLIGFKKPYSKAEAWIWMLSEAKYIDKKEFIKFGDKERLIETPRGSFTHSIRFLANKWGWSIDKVRRFLKYLENDSMLTQKQVQQITQITILNYNIYQGNGYSNEYSNQTVTKQQPNSSRTELIKDKKEKKEKNIIAKKSTDFSPDVLSLIDFFKETLPERLHPSKSQVNKWGDVFQKCMRLDGYDSEQIKEIVEVFRNDPFWKANFLSPMKLRKRNSDGVKYIDYFWQKLENIETDGMTAEEIRIKKKNDAILKKWGVKVG